MFTSVAYKRLSVCTRVALRRLAEDNVRELSLTLLFNSMPVIPDHVVGRVIVSYGINMIM